MTVPAMSSEDRQTLDFVSLWMARYVDGEANAKEVIGVLRHWPCAPWDRGRAGLPAPAERMPRMHPGDIGEPS